MLFMALNYSLFFLLLHEHNGEARRGCLLAATFISFFTFTIRCPDSDDGENLRPMITDHKHKSSQLPITLELIQRNYVRYYFDM